MCGVYGYLLRWTVWSKYISVLSLPRFALVQLKCIYVGLFIYVVGCRIESRWLSSRFQWSRWQPTSDRLLSTKSWFLRCWITQTSFATTRTSLKTRLWWLSWSMLKASDSVHLSTVYSWTVTFINSDCYFLALLLNLHCTYLKLFALLPPVDISIVGRPKMLSPYHLHSAFFFSVLIPKTYLWW